MAQTARHQDERKARRNVTLAAWRAKNREKLNTYYSDWKSRNIEKQKTYYATYYIKNKERYRSLQEAWREGNRDRIIEERIAYRPSARKKHLERKFGLSVLEYEAILDRQNGVCAICGTKPGTNRELAVDHDHETGRIRGLLCTSCNVSVVGRNSLESAIKVVEYLRNARDHGQD